LNNAAQDKADQPSSGHELYGDQLLDHLQHGWANLPNKTLLALVLGGVQVRMMRSLVTMVSIVLAIAFLTYTGLTNELYYQAALAVRSGEQVSAAQPQQTSQQATANRMQSESSADEVSRLRQMLRRAGISIDAKIAGDPMDNWLIIMALLTCMVGIANAMLMSVTERFREIGTMKCLGALDSLVVKIFLLESSVLGLVGAVMGMVFGAVVALLGGLLQLGEFGITYFPVAHSVTVGLWAAAAGIVLPVFGTVYPAIVAARMKPVDALRVDE